MAPEQHIRTHFIPIKQSVVHVTLPREPDRQWGAPMTMTKLLRASTLTTHRNRSSTVVEGM